MLQHYKYPVLLIEFEEDKAFSLEVRTETYLSLLWPNISSDRNGDQVLREGFEQVSTKEAKATGT